MNILIVASEAAPFSKTGGLADVCGSLPVEMNRSGNQCALIIPAYRQTLQKGFDIQDPGLKFSAPVGDKTVEGRILKAVVPGSNTPVYLIYQKDYFDRDGIYQNPDGSDYIDNCERYVFFCRSAMETIRLLDLKVDILHANDWQTGLIPAYLKTEYRLYPRYANIASLFTIHNLAYQGSFWHWDMNLTGLDWKYFNMHQMEAYGRLNLIKTGIAFADAVSTVSPRYALEIQSAPLGCGLEGILQCRSRDLYGILNGVDLNAWNPESDANIAQTYNVSTWREGKRACKKALLQQLGLHEDLDAPLLGTVGRLSFQKGYDLIAEVMRRIAPQHPAQWVVLGTGEACYQNMLLDLQNQYPNKIAVRLMYSDSMAHQIIAGSDLFLMPSRYEPCGLTQMYALHYGTLPIVHSTGGLADTVVNTTQQTLADNSANGFAFENDSIDEFTNCVNNALWTYYQQETRSTLIERGMKQDWSWSRSASQYVQLYEKIKH